MHAAIFGLVVADVIGKVLDLRHPPAPGGLQLIDSVTLTTGGNVCNTGIAMAKLGRSVAACGLVGEDVLGQAVTGALKSAGLDTSCLFATTAAQTSATMVAVEASGERAFFHTPGATRLLDAAVLRRCFGLFAKCDFVQIGYLGLLPGLTADLPVLLQELKKAAPHTRVALETVNPPGPWEQLMPMLPYLDIFCPSRTEAAALTGQSDPPRMVAAFRHFMKRGLIGIKLDAEGCYLDDGNEAVTADAFKIEVVDTTGAGDTWFAGLLTALSHKMGLYETARFANRVAADCCTAVGASAGVRMFEDTLGRSA